MSQLPTRRIWCNLFALHCAINSLAAIEYATVAKKPEVLNAFRSGLMKNGDLSLGEDRNSSLGEDKGKTGCLTRHFWRNPMLLLKYQKRENKKYRYVQFSVSLICFTFTRLQLSVSQVQFYMNKSKNSDVIQSIDFS